MAGRVGKIVVLLDTIAFTIHDPDDLPACKCSDHFQAILKSENGPYFSVHPSVHIETVQTVHVKSLLNGPTFNHIDNGHDLLFTGNGL